MGRKKWIGEIHMKKGALHRQMGIPEGEKIPKDKLEAASKKGGVLGHRANLALTLGNMRHKKKK
jgi:hypothetical protein